MKEHKFIAPLTVILPRRTKKDKKVSINQNVLKNLHYISYNNAKIIYSEILRGQLEGLKISTPVEIDYQVFKASKRKSDKMNFVSMGSKFFLDAVTNYNCWEDDSDEFVKTEKLIPTELDKDNPRLEITIREI